jgi:hypothetical protein
MILYKIFNSIKENLQVMYQSIRKREQKNNKLNKQDSCKIEVFLRYSKKERV